MNEHRNVRIRDGRIEDLPQLLALLQQLSENGATPETMVRQPDDAHAQALAELIQGPFTRLLVVEEDERIVGSCVLYLSANLSHGAARWAVVENVVIDSEERSKGYGELLMAEAVRLAREAGCYRVSLMSNLRRVDAHRFYERIGFTHSHKGFTLYLD